MKNETRNPSLHSELATNFHRGDHSAVLASGYVNPGADFNQDPETASFVVGSLAFLGRIGEAESLFKNILPVLPAQLVVACQFYLAVALCRHSDYAKGREYLGKNLRAARRSQNPFIRFYAAQGLGCYRFFAGRLVNARSHAEAALNFAIAANSAYCKCLAMDLYAHGLVLTGQISEGIAYLNRAKEFAIALGNGGCVQTLDISIICYEAQFGITKHDVLQTLNQVLASTDPQNSFSRTVLLLELARQYTLRGQGACSQEKLDEACRLIYAVQHRRQSATLNHRLAYNLFLAGNELQALNMLRMAKQEIDPKVDRLLDLQLSGLQLKLCKRLDLQDEAALLEKHVDTLTKRTGCYLGRRIALRDQIKQAAPALFPRGQDPIGDLYDLDEDPSDTGSSHSLFCAGYPTLSRTKWGLLGKHKTLVIDPTFQTFVTINPPSVQVVRAGIQRTLKALLLALLDGERTKEELIQQIWNYKYHPLRHDDLVYQSMTRVRKLLGDCGHWLEFTGTTYRINPQVKPVFLGPANQTLAEGLMDQDFAISSAIEPLSNRIDLMVEILQKQRFLNVKQCVELFQVSRITASRDLAALEKAKVVKRFGSGRATKYEIVKKRPRTKQQDGSYVM